MGFDFEETTQDGSQQTEKVKTENTAVEDNSAEKTLKLIATITLVMGIIATFVMLFTVCFVHKYGDYGRTVFNPSGLVVTCGVLMSTFISWATLMVFANISLTLKDINSKISK